MTCETNKSLLGEMSEGNLQGAKPMQLLVCQIYYSILLVNIILTKYSIQLKNFLLNVIKIFCIKIKALV